MDTMESDAADVERAYRLCRGIGIALAVAILGAALLTHRAPAPAATMATAPQADAAAERIRLDARRHRWATEALFSNLLDDDQPQRWSDLSKQMVCGEGMVALVNGEPVRIGERLPAAAFQLEFRLNSACPLGADGPRLSGLVQMVVVRDDEAGLVPVVLEQQAQ